MKGNAIPDRWLKYKPMGIPIVGTQFLAFKVPLKEELNRKVSPSERFSPQSLMLKYNKLSLIIDLTNTTRYYNKEEFLRNGIRYEKIFCRGREVPDMFSVKKFFKVVDEFLGMSNSDELIGVHCTHGLNRTGYLISRYMIQRMGINADDAISGFEAARGYKIERENYKEDLKRNLQDVPRVNNHIRFVDAKQRFSCPRIVDSQQSAVGTFNLHNSNNAYHKTYHSFSDRFAHLSVHRAENSRVQVDADCNEDHAEQQRVKKLKTQDEVHQRAVNNSNYVDHGRTRGSRRNRKAHRNSRGTQRKHGNMSRDRSANSADTSSGRASFKNDTRQHHARAVNTNETTVKTRNFYNSNYKNYNSNYSGNNKFSWNASNSKQHVGGTSNSKLPFDNSAS